MTALSGVARSVGASERAVYLGEKATETTLKALSKSGTLAGARILHFATHGLLAGETNMILGLTEQRPIEVMGTRQIEWERLCAGVAVEQIGTSALPFAVPRSLIHSAAQGGDLGARASRSGPARPC